MSTLVEKIKGICQSPELQALAIEWARQLLQSTLSLECDHEAFREQPTAGSPLNFPDQRIIETHLNFLFSASFLLAFLQCPCTYNSQNVEWMQDLQRRMSITTNSLMTSQVLQQDKLLLPSFDIAICIFAVAYRLTIGLPAYCLEFIDSFIQLVERRYEIYYSMF